MGRQVSSIILLSGGLCSGKVVVWSAMDMKTSQRGCKFQIFDLALWRTVLGRWSPEGQWRGKLSPISQRGCSPAPTEWCEEEKRERNSHFLYRKKQVLRTGSQFRKCMRRHPRNACITWNQTRFWFSIKFTHECCWKYSASFVLASGLFGACSASKKFLECTGIIIHHPWHLMIWSPSFGYTNTKDRKNHQPLIRPHLRSSRLVALSTVAKRYPN